MKKRGKRISSRSLYTILSIFVIILAGVVVSSVWSNPAVSHDSTNVKVTIQEGGVGVDYSLQEAINLNKMGVDWSQSISSILAQDLTVSGNAVFNNAVEFTDGLWSNAGRISAYEISADNYMSSPKIVSNEFCVGPAYATADCITEWPTSASGGAGCPEGYGYIQVGNIGCYTLNSWEGGTGVVNYRTAQQTCYDDYGGARLPTVNELTVAMITGLGGFSTDTWTGDVASVPGSYSSPASHWTIYGNSVGNEGSGQLELSTLEARIDTEEHAFNCWIPL